MKLHLPNLLSVAVMAAIALPSMGADVYPEIVETDDGNKYINVGHATTVNAENKVVLPAEALTDGVLKVGSGDLVGLFSGDPSTDTFVKSYYSSVASNTDHLNTISNSLTVDGDVEISGSGQIYLGGKSGSNHYSNLTAKNVTVAADATGISNATDPQKAPNLNLRADSAKLETLTVNSGAVHLRTFLDSGDNTYGPGQWGSWKSVGISKGLYVNGGYVLIGRQGNGTTQDKGNRSKTNAHFMSSIKGELKQTNGTLIMQGKTYIEASSIEQTGGNMELAYDNTAAYDYLRLGKSVTTITQNAVDEATNMHIEGKIIYGSTGKSNMQLNIEQKGVGTISLDNGVMFTSKNVENASNITQSGNGTINLAGDYSSAIFNVDQTASGTINLKKGAVMIANTVNVGKDATLNVDGSMTIKGKSNLLGTVNVGANAVFTLEKLTDVTLSTTLGLQVGNILNFNIEELDDSNGYMQVAEGGDLEFTGGSINLSLSEVAMQEMAAVADFEVGTVFNITLIDNLSDADVSELMEIINDTLVLNDYYVELPVTLAATSSEAITFKGEGLVVENNQLMAAVRVTNPGNIPEPATSTLSLLALAALAARRRRH